MNNEKPSYYAIIPANVRYDKRLKANEKLMFGEITCLAQSTGKCFASNSYFAELFGVSTTSISVWISNLAKYGYISRHIKYKKGTKEILNRYISLLTGGIKENLNRGIKENLKDNNTRNNNTRNNNYKKFIEFLKEKATIPSKVTSTRKGEELYKGIDDKKKLIVDYLEHQEEKGEFAKRITAYMEDYKATTKETVIINSLSYKNHFFVSKSKFAEWNAKNNNEFILLEDGSVTKRGDSNV